MTDTETDVGDKFELRKDGRILLRFNDTDYLLRMPKLGEYKLLKMRIADVSGSLAEKAEELQGAAAQVAAIPDDATDTDKRVAELKAQLDAGLAANAITDVQNDLMAEVAAEIIETLNGATVAPDDIPPWMIRQANIVAGRVMEQGTFGQMFEHWRTVPLAPGR